MARPRQSVKVQIPPRVRGFIPIGYYSNPSEPVQLNIEEYEAIRLLDYEGLSQVEAAKLMQVSRPTLTRIYIRARKKIAVTITEARQILIEGGNAIFNGNWFMCKKCKCKFDKTNGDDLNCPLCGSESIINQEG